MQQIQTPTKPVELDGDLSVLSLEDVLSIISNKHHSGRLKFETGGGTTTLYCEDGSVVGASAHVNNRRVGEALVQLNFLSQVELAEALESAGDDHLAETLMEGGRLKAEDWQRAFDLLLQDELILLFGLNEGDFHFEIEEIDFPQVLRRTMEVEPFLQLGRDLLARWNKAQEIVSDLHLRPQTCSLDGFQLRDVKLSWPEWSVLSLINGRNDVTYLCRQSGLGRLETLEALGRLMEMRLVETPEEVAPESPSEETTAGKADEGTGVLAVLSRFVNQYGEKVKSKSRGAFDEETLAREWSAIRGLYPLTDLLSFQGGQIHPNGFHHHTRLFQAEAGRDDVERQSEQALCMMAVRIHELAEEHCGHKWATNNFNKTYKAVVESSRANITDEERQRLSLRRLT